MPDTHDDQPATNVEHDVAAAVYDYDQERHFFHEFLHKLGAVAGFHHHHRGDDDIIVHQHDGEPNHEHDVTSYNDKLGYDNRACYGPANHDHAT